VFEAAWCVDDAKEDGTEALTVAVKVFRASGTLASFLRRVYLTSSSSAAVAALVHPSVYSSTPSHPTPPLPEALRRYIREHHHHRRPPEEEDGGEGEYVDVSNHDANEPGVYAARELLAMYLVG